MNLLLLHNEIIYVDEWQVIAKIDYKKLTDKEFVSGLCLDGEEIIFSDNTSVYTMPLNLFIN
jgi:hypothetical protein